jgi:hypothetical protein
LQRVKRHRIAPHERLPGTGAILDVSGIEEHPPHERVKEDHILVCRRGQIKSVICGPPPAAQRWSRLRGYGCDPIINARQPLRTRRPETSVHIEDRRFVDHEWKHEIGMQLQQARLLAFIAVAAFCR